MDINKKIKKQIIEEASSSPEKYFPVKTLESLGLRRQKCSKCSVMFWSKEKRNICGDTNCVGEYTFIENTPAKVALEFTEVWLKFKDFMKKRGYEPVERFPVVARWRDDLDFNIASIIGFQPYVTKGEVAPPYELLTIPQNCMRFSDIDNVGYTGRHFTGFTMIGQCAFKKPDEYDQAKYVKDLYEWFIEEVKIPAEEIQIHEDAWLGGGDCGASLEFFSRGLEIGNQVYMWYDMSSAQDINEIKPLKIKVLDMGMGMERCSWFSKGSLNAYEATMPKVCKYLFEKSKIRPNLQIYKKFLPFSGMLNLDEADDIDKVWGDIANSIKLDVGELKLQIEPIAGIYAIADHTRTLLYALCDGALPSNVKGGYNLRLILRRSLDFIYKFNWDIDLFEVIKMHAKELKELYPELEFAIENPTMRRIIEVEVQKYKNHKEKVESKIKSLIKKSKELNVQDYIKFYISDGIMPQEIQESFKNQGLSISIPQNFYTLVTEYFESRKISEVKQTRNKLSEFIKDIEPTELVFYKDSTLDELDAKIIKEFDFEGAKYIILDKTIFYPTMGGQASDKGSIGDYNVLDVIKIESVLLHKVEKSK